MLPTNEQTDYIAGIQTKEIPKEWQRYSTALNGTQYDLILHKLDLKNLPVFENNVIHEVFGNEFASSKELTCGKKSGLNKNKKRKFSGNFHDHIAKKKSTCQATDSLSGNEDIVGMEYCNAKSNFITVESRDYQHTLRPRKNPVQWSCTGSSDTTQRDSIASEESVTVTSDGRDSTNMVVTPLLSTGNRDLGGNGSESDDDNLPRNKPEVTVSKEKVSDLDKRIFNSILERFLDKWSVGSNKTIKDHLEHAYLNCPIHKGTQSYCPSNSDCRAAKKFFEDTINQMTSLNTDVKNQQYSVISDVLLCHSIKCNDRPCSVPLCEELWKYLFKEIKETSEDSPGYSRYGDDALEVIYSNTVDLVAVSNENNSNNRSSNKVKLEDFRINWQRQIGKGAFGKVYKAWVCTRRSEASMAIKKMCASNQESPDVDQMTAYLREVGKSPYLLTPDLVISSVDRKLTYVAMECGEIALSGYLDKVYQVHCSRCRSKDHLGPCNAGLPPELCAQFFKQILEGVQHLHQRDLVHADIKSANVVIMPGFKQIKLIDFDMIKKEGTRKQCGTPGYVAPEILDSFDGNCIKPSDVFAASIILPEMFFAGLKMVCNQIENIDVYKSFLKERNTDLYKCMKKHHPQLAELFKRGTEWDPSERATCSMLLQCFKQNRIVRNLYKALIDVPPLTDVVIDRQGTTMADQNNNVPIIEKLASKIVKNWCDQELEKLPRQLPVASYDPTWNYDNQTVEIVDDDIDVPLDDILNNTHRMQAE